MDANLSPNEILRALAKAKKAGDHEVANLLREDLVQAYRDENKTAVTRDMSGFQRFRAGVGQGMMNVARHAGNLVGAVSDEELSDHKELDRELLSTRSGRIGSLVGESAVFAPAGGGLVSGARALGANLFTRGVGRGVLEGAAQGYVMADPGERGIGALTGGVAGSILPGATQTWKSFRSGVRPTREARRLMQEGVDLTPGQMNPRGVMSHVEQAASGLPVVKTFVGNARDRAKEQFQRLIVERSMPPGTQLATRSTNMNHLVDEAARRFDVAYDVAKGFPVSPQIMRTTANEPLSAALARVASSPRVGLTSAARKEINGVLQSRLAETVAAGRTGGGLLSDHLLALRSQVRKEIRDEALDSTESRARASLLKDAEKQITDALESQIDPRAAQALRAVDAQYGNFAIVRNAAAKAKDAPGGPSIRNISQAVYEGTPRNAYARGGGRLRDLSQAAAATFEQDIPKTGLTGWGALGLGAVATMGAPKVMIPAAAATAGLIGTRTGRRLAAGQARGQQLARGLERTVRRTLPPVEVKVGTKSLGRLNPRELAALYGRSLAVSNQTT